MRRVLGIALVLGAGLLLPSPARADNDAVTIQDNFYSPQEVTVLIGDTVTWTHDGSTAHSVTDEGVFDSSPQCVALTGTGCMHKGDQFSITFNTAGRYEYHCRVQGTAMSGTVVVESTTTTESTTTSTTTATDAPSSASLSSLAPSTTDSSFSPASQFAPPVYSPTTRVAARKSVIARTSDNDDHAPLVIADVAIAGTTALVGVALVRKGRVPFG